MLGIAMLKPPMFSNISRPQTQTLPTSPAMATESFCISALPDEILTEIFLRLPSPASLLRAAMACTSFLHVIASPDFLLLFSSLHAAPGLLGFFDKSCVFHSAPFGWGVRVGHGFLPGGEWHIADGLHGRLLLFDDADWTPSFPDLIIADLSAEMCLRIPRPPLSSSEVNVFNLYKFLLAPEKIVCLEQPLNGDPFGKVFVDDSWHRFQCLLAGNMPHNIVEWEYGHNYAHGYFYWYVQNARELVRMSLSNWYFEYVDIPGILSESYAFTIVEVSREQVGMYAIKLGITDADRSLLQYCVSMKDEIQWVMERQIALPHEFDSVNVEGAWIKQCMITGSCEEYLLLQAPEMGSDCFAIFAMCRKNMTLVKVSFMSGITYPCYPVTVRWPPLFPETTDVEVQQRYPSRHVFKSTLGWRASGLLLIRAAWTGIYHAIKIAKGRFK